jgi:hypothetical protein
MDSTTPENNQVERLEFLESKFAQLNSTNEFLSDTLRKIWEKLDDKDQAMHSAHASPEPVDSHSVYNDAEPGAPAPTVNKPDADSRRRIKPSPPAEFSGDRSKGRAFLNSCELYIRLAPHQFENDAAKVAWAYSYMKTGRAALFVDRMLRYEARSLSPRYTDWVNFRMAFKDEFFPKNERQRALTRLETNAYHQNKRSMDEYIDEFRDLIELAGYKEGVAIVMKFRKGLRRDIQDHIAQLAHGRPADSDPQAWYHAALCCAENQESNALFHGVARAPITTTSFRTFTSAPSHSIPVGPPRFQAPPVAPRPTQNPVPMDIDATRKKTNLPDVCYRCGEPGHRKPQCPRRFDIRLMSMEECEEWMQEKALGKDAEEIAQREEELAQEIEKEEGKDF